MELWENLWEHCPVYMNNGRAKDVCKFTESDTILEYQFPGEPLIQRPGPVHWSYCKHENCLFVMIFRAAMPKEQVHVHMGEPLDG